MQFRYDARQQIRADSRKRTQPNQTAEVFRGRPNNVFEFLHLRQYGACTRGDLFAQGCERGAMAPALE